MNAGQVMTRAVVTISPNALIADAVHLMLGQRISGLPVVEAAGRLIGILTEGDLLRRVEIGTDRHRPAWLEFFRGPSGQAKDYVRSHARRVEDLMTREVATVAETAPLDDIVRLMERSRIKRVPVITNDRLVGIVSRADLLRVLAKELETSPVMATDATIRQHLAKAVASQPWYRGNRVDAVVVDGIVFLEGQVYDERDRTAIRVAAENVPGVKAVEDHLEFVDPTLAWLEAPAEAGARPPSADALTHGLAAEQQRTV